MQEKENFSFSVFSTGSFVQHFQLREGHDGLLSVAEDVPLVKKKSHNLTT